MEDGKCCYMASPPDMSVTSSTSCTDDQSVKTSVCMTDNLHSSDRDAEVSSSCEMLPPVPACSVTAVDPLNNQVGDCAFLLCDARSARAVLVS